MATHDDSSVSEVNTVSEKSDVDLHTVSQQTLTVNGVQLGYWKKGNGPHAILCIPGALAPSRWAFSSQLEHFGREDSGYTIVAYDPRGYGHSRPPERKFCLQEEHHLKRDASDAYHLMKSLGFSEFSMLGWCDGGVSGICLAAQFPTAVRKLVVWGSRTYITDHDLKLTEKLEDFQRWAPQFFETYLSVYGLPQLSQIWQRFLNSLRTFRNLKTDGDVCTNELSKVKCPTLIVHGEKDVLCPQSHAEYMNDHIVESQLHILTDGKHDLHMYPINGFNTVVEEFLRQ